MYTFIVPAINLYSLTQRIAPWQIANRTGYHSFYAQDQWTLGRATVQGAVRYDHAYSFHPAEGNGSPIASRWNPTPISFPRTDGVKGYNDITPRVGLAYDLFGNGKTSLKVNVGKYLESANNQGNYQINNPASDGRNGRFEGSRFQVQTSRTWFDNNGDFVPQCELMNPAPNGECLGWDNLGFGNVGGAHDDQPGDPRGVGRPAVGLAARRVDPAGSPPARVGRSRLPPPVVRQLLRERQPRRGTVGLRQADADGAPEREPARRWWLSRHVLRRQTREVRPGQQLLHLRNRLRIGADVVYWHGVDINISARVRNGLTFQGGTSSGRGVRDTCALWDALPELIAPFNAPFGFPLKTQVNACHVDEPFLTQVRGLATYEVPKIDVQLGASFRSVPGTFTSLTNSGTTGSNGFSLNAVYTPAPGEIEGILGRSQSNALAQYNLLLPGQMYTPRLTYFDLRAAKVLRFGGTRTEVGFDLYNLFNSNTATALNTNYGATFLQPTGIQSGRLARFNVTIDF